MNGLRLDLGCGARKAENTIGIDVLALPGVDYVVDLQESPLPFPDRSVEYIHSSHFFEHIDREKIFKIYAESSRVCQDGAYIEIWTPYGWDNSAFIFGHHNFYFNEDHYLHMCVWFQDTWRKTLGANWLLKEFIYVVLPDKLVELYRNKISIDFALRHYKCVVQEFGVLIQVRHDYTTTQKPVMPERKIALNRSSKRYAIVPDSKAVDENELQSAIEWHQVSPS